MIEFNERIENGEDGTVTTKCEIVFVTPDNVSATHRKFQEFNPTVAEMLRDRFAEAVAGCLEILKNSHGIVLEPVDYDMYGDLLVSLQVGQFGINPPSSVGAVLTDGSRLSMRFTASPEAVDLIKGFRANVGRSFDLLVNAYHCEFLRREVP